MKSIFKTEMPSVGEKLKKRLSDANFSHLKVETLVVKEIQPVAEHALGTLKKVGILILQSKLLFYIHNFNFKNNKCNFIIFQF